jgi:hypothetical protein
MFYNLKTNSFTKNLPNVNETDFLRVTTCDHKNKQVVTLISFDNEPICLHNEDEETDKLVFELFVNEDINFINHLDFFNNQK